VKRFLIRSVLAADLALSVDCLVQICIALCAVLLYPSIHAIY
jgi:hypothetical protein